jgi:hypothetical protein
MKRPTSCQRTRYGVTTLPRAIWSDKVSKSKQKNMGKSVTLVLGGIEVCPYRTRFQTPLGIISYTVARSYFARSYLVSHTKKGNSLRPLRARRSKFSPLIHATSYWTNNALFLCHWQKNSVVGKLPQIALRWFQVQTRVSYPILQQVSSPLPQLEFKWIASLRAFLHSIGASIWVDNSGTSKLQRIHMVVLMDVIQSSACFSDREICQLNYCRLYLKAVTMSDITTVSGTSLDVSKSTGAISLQCGTNLGPEIYQERPSPPTW